MPNGTTSVQAVTYRSVNDGTGAFTVSGAFWLPAPPNSIVPQPLLTSVVPNITSSDLAALRSGQTIEIPFQAPQSPNLTYPSGTTQATVDADIQGLLAAAQASIANANPGLATAVGRAFNGATWSPYGGSPVGPLVIGAQPQIVTPIYLAIAQGQQPNIASGRAFGYASAVTAAAARILATTYAPAAPGAAAQRSLSSSSAADTAAGTGARTVTVTYLTTAFAVKQETVTLNGVTAVATVGTDIAYIESMTVATSGSGLTNAGTITLFNNAAGAGGTFGTIATGDGQTNWAHHYVPAGKTCLIIDVTFGGSLAAGRGFISRTGDPSQSTLPILPLGGQYAHVLGGSIDHPFQVPIIVPGPDRIFLTEFPNTAVASNVAFGAFEYVQF